VPNAIARSLKAQRSDIVGAVVPATGEYWQHVVTSFARVLREHGKQLLLFSFDEMANVEPIIDTVAQYRLDGVILASADISTSQMHHVSRSGLPAVAFNQPVAQELIPAVTVDNELGMRLLATHLIERGVQSSVFVGGRSDASTDESRFRGASAAMAVADVPCRYVAAGSFTYDAGYKIAAELAADLPDAFMVASDEIAFGLIDGLRQAGVEVPRDVLITGFDGLPQAAWAGYDLTTLTQPTELLVEHALSQLTGVASERHFVVPGTIRQGKTTHA